METKDTHGFVAEYNRITYENGTFHGAGKSEAVKISNRREVTFKNCVILGGKEDCLDIVRGSIHTFDNCVFEASGSLQAATIKGGAEYIHFKNCTFKGKPKMGYVVLGQYSDYNFCKDLKTKYISFDKCHFEDSDTPSVVVWKADMPIIEECYANVKKIPTFIVWAYFTFRKLQQRIVHGKNGRNDCCLQYK